MKNLLCAIAAVAFVSSAAAAQPAADFEMSIRSVRATVLDAQRKHRQAATLSASDDLKQAFRDARELIDYADDLYFQMENIRQRADLVRAGRQDPTLMSDANLLVYHTASFDNDGQSFSQWLSNLEHTVPADPTLKQQANDLLDAAHRLRSSTARDFDTAQWMRASLIGIGLGGQGTQAVLYLNEALQFTSDAETSADNIREKVGSAK